MSGWRSRAAVVAALGLGVVPVGAEGTDLVPQLLRARAAGRAAAPLPGVSGLAAPRVLLSHRGDDNACAVLLRPDADSDAVPDLVAGWDIFKTGDNLEVLSGGGLTGDAPVWGLETADGISGGYFSDLDQLTTYPDLDGDGIDELLTATSGGGRAATLYDGATGTVLQSFNTYLGTDSGWVYDIALAGDVNGNGSIDFAIAVGSDADAVYMVDGATAGVHHDEIWQFSGVDAFFTLAVLGDVDGDGVIDLAAGSGDNARDVHLLSGATGSQIWQVSLDGSVLDLGAYPDFDGDGVDEVIAGSWDAETGVRLLRGRDGREIWSSGALDTFIMRVVAIDDVDSDGAPEIAVASWANEAYVLSGRTGRVVWSAPTGGDVWAIDRVDDVTGDGLSEVAFGSFDGFAYLADGRDGSLLWAHDANGHKVLALASGPDLDGDGNPEIVAGAQQLDSGDDDLVWVLSADSGIATAGPELALEGEPLPGARITLRLTQGVAGHGVRWLWGTRPGLAPLPGLGFLAVQPGRRLADGFVDANGEHEVEIEIPADDRLIGRRFYVQAVTVVSPPEPIGRTTERLGFDIQAP